MFGLNIELTILLFLCLLAVCIFEFINGFHDTANAVATVIYTNSLKPYTAVVLSGILNFTGVIFGGISVAMGIVNLLPMEIFLQSSSLYQSIALILSILLSAIIWNLGTWYYGIPCSSSHTLIGAIIGAGVGYSVFGNGALSNVNWEKAGEIGLSLLISPLFGFGFTILLMFLLRTLVKNPKIFQEPEKDKTPPWWIRGILILTCSGVSLSHGSNDGQKGVGLMMLILIAIVPIQFALVDNLKPSEVRHNIQAIEQVLKNVEINKLSQESKTKLAMIHTQIAELDLMLKETEKATTIPENQRFAVRKNIMVITKELGKLVKENKLKISKEDKAILNKHLQNMKSFVEYAPFWVVLLISFSLGIGTMIGWKRIVVTIGEKIGKEHLTYAQGASSEIVAASTIGVSTFFGLPVSTTHVLSSGVAGSMVANKGLANLQSSTIRNILIAWILTLPISILLSVVFFGILKQIM
ncbi:MAG: inorganic phosphate transporter [Microscillaceae bacterium]|nr:inorganic phosphate transporter [Microscillaceae bacterium]